MFIYLHIRLPLHFLIVNIRYVQYYCGGHIQNFVSFQHRETVNIYVSPTILHSRMYSGVSFYWLTFSFGNIKQSRLHTVISTYSISYILYGLKYLNTESVFIMKIYKVL